MSRRPWSIVLLFAVLAAGQAAALRGPAPAARDYAEAFERVWTTTRNRFYDPKMHGVDWEAVRERYREAATSAQTADEFSRVVNQMLRELKASHTGFYTPDDLEYYLLQAVFQNESAGPQMEHIGVTGQPEKDGFRVRAILDGSPAVRVGVHVGDLLLEAGGRPFTTVGAFRGRSASSVLLALYRPGEGNMTVTVRPVIERSQEAFLNATKRSVRIIDRGGKRYGYVHLWAMAHDVFRQALDTALLETLADTDGLVLDLRDGFGGKPDRFADVLMRPDVVWTQNVRGNTVSRHTGYAKPVVALINGGSRSAKEYLTYQLHKANRALLVGTHTAGAFLSAGGFSIEPVGLLELPVSGLQLDGVKLEGVGVPPDVVVEPKNTYQPDDRQLARALELLEKRVGAAAGGAGG